MHTESARCEGKYGQMTTSLEQIPMLANVSRIPKSADHYTVRYALVNWTVWHHVGILSTWL